MIGRLNLAQLWQKKESDDPLDDQKKYFVKRGHLVVAPNELAKSEKVKRQLKTLKEHFNHQ